jgi:hypothetical protein
MIPFFIAKHRSGLHHDSLNPEIEPYFHTARTTPVSVFIMNTHYISFNGLSAPGAFSEEGANFFLRLPLCK